MSVVIDRIKEHFHRDVVSDPVVHGWVLNLYRAGERYPQTVTDYFPAEHAPSTELAASLRRHRHDEERHTAMYAHAIRALQQPVVDFDGDDMFNVVIRSFTEESFTIDERDSLDVRRWKLANFLAHAHFLEKRIARSLEYHRDACERGGVTVAERVVTAVLADEKRHVSYTLEAARELLTNRERPRVLAHHRRAEAKANLAFSQRQVRAYARRCGAMNGRYRAAFYRLCGFVMDQAVAFV